MITQHRELLRLHIEAVWGVHLPPITQDTVDLLLDGTQPSWKLYIAEMANSERVAIWRPDVEATEREALLAYGSEALSVPPIKRVEPHLGREVALHQAASPSMSVTAAQQTARLLTTDDQALIEVFSLDSYADFFHAETQPFIGVVISGQLLSLAHSSRRTLEACELGIDTLPKARRKGYGLAATIVWTHIILQERLVPIYSADASNTASLSLAEAAGYRPFARAVIIEEQVYGNEG